MTSLQQSEADVAAVRESLPEQAAGFGESEAEQTEEQGLDDLPWGSPVRGQGSALEESDEEVAKPQKKAHKGCLLS